MTKAGDEMGTLEAIERYEAERIVRRTFPDARVLDAEPVAGTFRNSNTRLTLENAPSPLFLRQYVADPTGCTREVAALRALPAVVPVPTVVDASPYANPPWALFSWVEGGRLDRALRLVDRGELLMLANDVGAVLSAVHQALFEHSSKLGPNLVPVSRLDTWSVTMRSLLAGPAGERLGPVLTRGLDSFVDRHAAEMDGLYADAALCHGNLTLDNLLIGTSGERDARRKVAGLVAWSGAVLDTADRHRLVAIVDWETAFAGPPLVDAGAFLRHEEKLPKGFADEFADGYHRWEGVLPPDWRRLARRLDLVAVCRLVERGGEPALDEAVPLIEATLGAD